MFIAGEGWTAGIHTKNACVFYQGSFVRVAEDDDIRGLLVVIPIPYFLLMREPDGLRLLNLCRRVGLKRQLLW